MRFAIVAALSGLALSACGSPPAREEAKTADADSTANQATAKAALPSCPFRAISDLKGSIEEGRLLVTGRVDLMMAGFRPQLTPREGAAGVLALDLALVPEANAGVSDVLRYERHGVPRLPRGEIWCGGEKIADFEVVRVD